MHTYLTLSRALLLPLLLLLLFVARPRGTYAVSSRAELRPDGAGRVREPANQRAREGVQAQQSLQVWTDKGESLCVCTTDIVLVFRLRLLPSPPVLVLQVSNSNCLFVATCICILMVYIHSRPIPAGALYNIMLNSAG